MSHATILVAEDFAAFREFACDELRQRPDFRVVPVADGLAAVQKAAELRPELAVLDIGLPTLNGLSAARHIRLLCPESRIVFLTKESSPEVEHEAFNLGCQVFIDKARARYLLPTVETILDGNGHQRHYAQFWGDEATMIDVITNGRGSIMPAWVDRLDAVTLKALAVYVHTLGGGK